MFAKLVILILVFGGSGMGLLSVRQSRIQAVHEMAEARHRVLRLDEQGGEIETLIARSCTPERIHQLLDRYGEFQPANLARAEIDAINRVYESPIEIGSPTDSGDLQSETDRQTDSQAPRETPRVWILSDGSRVVFSDQ